MERLSNSEGNLSFSGGWEVKAETGFHSVSLTVLELCGSGYLQTHKALPTCTSLQRQTSLCYAQL